MWRVEAHTTLSEKNIAYILITFKEHVKEEDRAILVENLMADLNRSGKVFNMCMSAHPLVSSRLNPIFVAESPSQTPSIFLSHYVDMSCISLFERVRR